MNYLYCLNRRLKFATKPKVEQERNKMKYVTNELA